MVGVLRDATRRAGWDRASGHRRMLPVAGRRTPARGAFVVLHANAIPAPCTVAEGHSMAWPRTVDQDVANSRWQVGWCADCRSYGVQLVADVDVDEGQELTV